MNTWKIEVNLYTTASHEEYVSLWFIKKKNVYIYLQHALLKGFNKHDKSIFKIVNITYI